MSGLLFDSQILIAILNNRVSVFSPSVRNVIETRGLDAHASVASLWEIAIKVRLGKLPLAHDLGELPAALQGFGIALLPVEPAHALADLHPLPPTRDPFDRLLLAQCLVEDMRLVTVDRALVDHPLAWRPA